MMKVCTGCKIEKEFDKFGKDKKGLFGYNQKCKECCNARAKLTIHSVEAIEKRKKYRSEWQKSKRPILNERLKERYLNNLERSRELGRARSKRYMQTEKGKAKHIEATEKYVEENREKIRAQSKVRKAIKSGKIIKPLNCEVCGLSKALQGHHEDYSKPLQVIWMCAKCHIYHHHKHRFHAERLNEETPKGDAKV